MRLSDIALRNAKPRDKAFRLADGHGLHLLVQPKGSKLWQLRYRFLGKENVLSFGPYPLVSLAEAREQRDAARKLLLKGIDPAAQRRTDQREAQLAARRTFGQLAEEYVERMKESGAAEATIEKTTWLLYDLASPLAKRPMRDIHPADILDILRRIEKSGRRETARRLRGVIGSVFRYAIVTLRADSDPTTALQGALLPPKVIGRAAITEENEFGRFLAVLGEYDGWPTVKTGLQSSSSPASDREKSAAPGAMSST